MENAALQIFAALVVGFIFFRSGHLEFEFHRESNIDLLAASDISETAEFSASDLSVISYLATFGMLYCGGVFFMMLAVAIAGFFEWYWAVYVLVVVCLWSFISWHQVNEDARFDAQFQLKHAYTDEWDPIGSSGWPN